MTNMRFTSLFRSLLLGTILLTACAPSAPQPPSGWSTYENAEMGVRMFHPSDWTYTENGAGEERMVLFAAPDTDDPGYASMAGQPLPEQGMDLAAYTAYYVDAMGPAFAAQGMTVETLTSEETTMAGQPAHRLTFILRGANSTKAVAVWATRADRVYTFNFSTAEAAFDASAPVRDVMLGSVTLL